MRGFRFGAHHRSRLGRLGLPGRVPGLVRWCRGRGGRPGTVGPVPARAVRAVTVRGAAVRGAVRGSAVVRSVTVAAPAGQDLRRDQRGRPGAAVARGVERHQHAEPRGQPGHHEQAQAGVGPQRHRVELRWLAHHPVGPLADVVLHAEATVGDVDDHAAGHHGAGDLHRRPGRGERGGVVGELGDQVDGVRHGRPDDRDVRDVVHLDPGEVLGLGDRGPQHVHQRDRFAPPAAGVFAAEDDEVLGGAPGAGGQVVQLEQSGELFGVLLAALHPVQDPQLAVHQALGAVGDAEEDVVHTRAGLRLADGRVDRGALGDVERFRHLADLVAPVVQLRHLGVHVDVFAVAEAPHDVRQAGLGEFERVAAQPFQPGHQRAVHQGPRDPDRDDDRGDGGEQCRHTAEDDVAQVPVGVVQRLRRHVVRLLHGECGQPLGDVLGELTPLVRADAGPAGELDRAGPLADQGVLRVVQPLPRGRGRQTVVGLRRRSPQVRPLFLQAGPVGADELGEAQVLGLAERTAGQGAGGQGGGTRHLVRHPEHVGGAECALGGGHVRHDTGLGVEQVRGGVGDLVVEGVDLLRRDRPEVDLRADTGQLVETGLQPAHPGPDLVRDEVPHRVHRLAEFAQRRVDLPLPLLELVQLGLGLGQVHQTQPALLVDRAQRGDGGDRNLLHTGGDRPDVDGVGHEVDRHHRPHHQERDTGDEGRPGQALPDRLLPTVAGVVLFAHCAPRSAEPVPEVARTGEIAADSHRSRAGCVPTRR